MIQRFFLHSDDFRRHSEKVSPVNLKPGQGIVFGHLCKPGFRGGL